MEETHPLCSHIGYDSEQLVSREHLLLRMALPCWKDGSIVSWGVIRLCILDTVICMAHISRAAGVLHDPEGWDVQCNGTEVQRGYRRLNAEISILWSLLYTSSSNSNTPSSLTSNSTCLSSKRAQILTRKPADLLKRDWNQRIMKAATTTKYLGLEGALKPNGQRPKSFCKQTHWQTYLKLCSYRRNLAKEQSGALLFAFASCAPVLFF